jgi:peptidoglycan hydrolase-like protein with peptidoglycan-binding domain
MNRTAAWGVRAAAVALAVGGAALLGAGPANAAADTLQGCGVLREGPGTSDCVRTLQRFLNLVNPAHALRVDGRYGEGVRKAVLDFQGRNHLGADGVVGRRTAELLESQARARSNGAGRAPAAPQQPLPDRPPTTIVN